jgi:hypothetical protein
MADGSNLPGFVLVSVTTAAVLLALVALWLTQLGPRRPGLVAGMLPLALVAPVVAIPYASWKLIHMFSGMAQADSPTGGMRLVLDAAASLWRLQRFAWGGFAASCAVGVLVGLIRHAGSSDDVRCSVRRGAVLLLIPILGLLAAGALAWQLSKAMRVAVAVVSPVKDDPASQKRSDDALAAQGLDPQGHIADISEFIALRMMAGVFGGGAVLIALVGLGLTGLILAWRVRFGTSFLALASAVWLLAGGVASLVSLGVLDPLRLP